MLCEIHVVTKKIKKSVGKLFDRFSAVVTKITRKSVAFIVALLK